jgi:hypothetical protein
LLSPRRPIESRAWFFHLKTKEKIVKISRLARAATAAITLCVGFAQASPTVTTWSVVDVAKFVPGTVLPNGGFPNPVLSNNDTELHWGNTNPQSGLIITNAPGALIVPTGVLSSTVQIRHDNFPIPAGNSLTSVDILASLSLTSSTPTVGATIPGAITFGVRFIETPNGGSNGICADGMAVNSGGVNANGCADIFVIQNNALNFVLAYDSDGAVNGYDPQNYFVSFFADGFGTLSNAACASAGAAAGCRGFETAEGVSTSADFKILITDVPFTVPEPGSMTLFGIALAALGCVSLRRKQ